MTKQRVFVFFTGEYEQRCISSVHSSRESVDAAVALIYRNNKAEAENADIEEYVLDPGLCATCGYDEDIHKYWEHPFVLSKPPDEPSEPL